MVEFQFHTRKINSVIITEVNIDCLKDGHYFGYGVKSPKDNHWKAKGQQAAVKYAIKDIDDHVLRDDIWNEFFNYSTATRRLKPCVK